MVSTQAQVTSQASLVDIQSKENCIAGRSPRVMTKIYEDQVNLVVLQRSQSKEVDNYCQELLERHSNFNLRTVINPEKCLQAITSSLPKLTDQSAFVADIVLLIEMYSCLFDLEEIGLRLQVLDRAMCPRFHIDRLGCRLVCTYSGPGTQWLFNSDVDRSKLGTGNKGLGDDKSGIYTDPANIQQVKQSDVVLLKGDGWFNNEGLGIVHRSPIVPKNNRRLVVTMDFA
jgi:hypothetical protein